jgi:dTDP-4-amino-4,6-dideoxygalactose transaminase
VYTTKESERLTRLPLYYKLSEQECQEVIRAVQEFYAQ